MSDAAVVTIVDDEDEVRAALGRLLASHGLHGAVYKSAANSCWPRPIRSPGCVLLDLRMPGPGGLELQASLGRQEDAPAVVFMSGKGDIKSSVLAIPSRRDRFPHQAHRRGSPGRGGDLGAGVRRLAARRTAAPAGTAARYSQLSLRERAVFDQVVAVGSTSRSPVRCKPACAR
jgi:FixJ family two-component response regulator